MPVSNDLPFPETEELFEEMCFLLYKAEWRDPFLNRLGSSGQGQFGLDLMGSVNGQDVGIQCKHYVSTPFTLATVTGDLDKLDRSGVQVAHVIFATTAPNKAALVAQVRELSNQRRAGGQCGVAVHFWNELSALLRKHSDVARTCIPGFPGSTLLQIRDTAEATLVAVQDAPGVMLAALADMVGQRNQQATASQELIARPLELASERLLQGRPQDVLEVLGTLGDPALLGDASAQFRWHAIKASALLMSSRAEEAAREYLVAASILPDLEKAYRHKAHAHILLGDMPKAMAVVDEGLAKYPESSLLWSLRANAQRAAGDPDPGKDTPAHLRETTDVLFTMSVVRHQQGRFEEAFDLIQRCIKGDKPSFELNRLLLATALSWASSDPVASQLGQLEPGKRQALAQALQAHEPLEVTIPAIQHDAIAFEIASNAVIALLLQGDVARARRITGPALVRHPLATNLLRVRVHEIEVNADLPALRELAAGELAGMSDAALVGIAEAASNLNAPDVFERAASQLDTRSLPERERQDFAVLSFHAQWTAGARQQAIEQAKAHVLAHPTHMLGQVELARMLSRSGEDLAAALRSHVVEELAAAETASSLELSLAADLLRELRDHAKAAALYARLVHTPGADALTYKYTFCLIESGQRMKAQQLLDQLPFDVRQRSDFRRLEAELARRKGDWARTADLLRTELAQHPRNSTVAVNYVAALHRTTPLPQELADYLSSVPQFDGNHPTAEVEFAKYEAQYGLPIQALQRLYRLLRDNPGDTMLAGSYLAHMFLGNLGVALSAVQPAGPGTSVLLKAPGEMFEIAIDMDQSPHPGWPELVGADSVAARALLGKAVGDTVVLQRNLALVECEIAGITSVLLFAVERAATLLHTTANNDGPAWSVNLQGPDGQIDVDRLLAPQRAKAQGRALLLQHYRASMLPLSTLAKTLGEHTLELTLQWPRDQVPMFVSYGGAEDRAAQFIALQSSQRRYVIDLMTLGEFVALGLFRNVAPLIGKPLVPTAVRDELCNLLEADRHLLIREDFPVTSVTALPAPSPEKGPEQTAGPEGAGQRLTRRTELFQEMLSCIDELCELTPVLGPAVLTDAHRGLEIFLDDATLDCVHLCLERDAILLTEDGALRNRAAAAGITTTVNVQPVLMAALNSDLISHAQYVDAMSSKIVRNHDFINLRSVDLLHMVGHRPRALDPKVLAALDTLRRPQLDLSSGVIVAFEMLQGMVDLVPAKVFREYFSATLDALVSNRPQQAAVIHNALAQEVHSKITQLPKRRQSSFLRAMGALLQPQPMQQGLRMSPIALAVHELFSQGAGD